MTTAKLDPETAPEIRPETGYEAMGYDEAIHTRQEALEKRVLLLAPTIGWWQGRYQLPRNQATVVVDDHEVEQASVTVPCVKLLNKQYPTDRDGMSWLKRFQTIASLEKDVIGRYSVTFPIRGVRIIPKKAGAAFFHELFGLTLGEARIRFQKAAQEGNGPLARRLDAAIEETVQRDAYANRSTPVFDADRERQSVARQLYEAAEEFCDDLPRIMEQIRQHTDTVAWSKVQHKIPHRRDDMRKKFYLDATPIELAGGLSQEVTAADLADHNDVIREACRRKVEEAIEEMVAGPREELAAALARLQTLIASEGRVTEKSFAGVRAAIAKIRLFDFAANPGLLKQITDIEYRLNATVPSELTPVVAAESGFASALAAWQDEVTNAQQRAEDLSRFGTLRRIDLS